MSALRSSAGPAVWTNGTPSSSATIRARLVLPSPGGPASSTWSSASPRAAAAAIETPSCSLQRLLADELVEPLRAQRRVEVVLGALDAASGGAPDRRGRADHHARRRLERVGDEVLGRPAVGAVEQLLGLLRREAEPDEARRAPAAAGRRRGRPRSGRPAAPRRPSRAARRRSAPRCACRSPARPAAARCRPRRRRPAARAACRRESTASATFGPDALDADQEQEEVALRLGREAEELERVVAHDQVRVQRRRLPTAGVWRSVSAETASR